MSYECKCVDLLDVETAGKLAKLLRGICQGYEVVTFHEVLLRAPLQGGSTTTDLKMIRALPDKVPPTPRGLNPAQDRWLVVHEGGPLMGQSYQELPASVRDVAESQCYGSEAVGVWLAQGARVVWETVKSGQEYYCRQGDFDVKVCISQLHLVQVSGAFRHPPVAMNELYKTKRLGTSPLLASHHYLVEVTTSGVPDGRQVEAAMALGTFSRRLQPHVQMKNPNHL